MDRETVIQLAREAGAITNVKHLTNIDGDGIVFVPEELERFANAIEAKTPQPTPEHTKAMQQALGAIEAALSDDQPYIARSKEAVTALQNALSQQPSDCHQLKPLTDDDFYVVPEDKSTPEWTVWVCPKPKGYLMKCCDCGLVHEVDFRVVKYDPRPSEEFSVISDPDLQAQFRMRRYDK